MTSAGSTTSGSSAPSQASVPSGQTQVEGSQGQASAASGSQFHCWPRSSRQVQPPMVASAPLGADASTRPTVPSPLTLSNASPVPGVGTGSMAQAATPPTNTSMPSARPIARRIVTSSSPARRIVAKPAWPYNAAMSTRAPAFAVLLLLSIACGAARVSSVPVPPPRAPFALALTLAGQGASAFVAQLDLTGTLQGVDTDHATGDLVLTVADGTRVAAASMPPALEPARAAAWKGQAVRLTAEVAPDAVDLQLTGADGRVLLLVVSRRFAERLPGLPDQWGTPPDLPLKRVSDVSVLRTSGDANDCVAVSVHYPLEVAGGRRPLRLPPDVWQPATWRGQGVALLNREAWMVRRSSCPGVGGAGFTVLVRDEPDASAPQP